jgi:hypothetical protein
MGAGTAGFFRGTAFWHLAFWVWMGSVAVFLFFASAVGMLRGKDEMGASRCGFGSPL